MQKEYKFEQYKMFAESAEKNSERRITQNNIYLGINLAFVSYICVKDIELKMLIMFALIGVIICVIWYKTIGNYSKRNKVKYDIINEMESEFGLLYKEEWKRISVLTPLSRYEQSISIIFLIIYIIVPIIKYVIK